MKCLSLYLLFVLLVVEAKADVVLPNVFSSHMVLQRNQSVAIFGTATAGEVIRVEFKGQHKQTVADEQGNWKVMLKAMSASAVGHSLIVLGNNIIQLDDVLVGEVWLCSGQSNMEYTMRKVAKEKAPLKGNYFPKNEIEEANNTQIRIFLVRRKLLEKVDGKYEGWSVAEGNALRLFSAPAYFFGKKLQEELDIPVGIISSAVSGSRIEPWYTSAIEGEPSKFFQTMIKPLAPYTLRGFVWYQGETNVFLKESLSYAYKLNALIKEWRDTWNNPKIPFYFTQIAPFHYSLDEKGEIRMPRTVLPEFREAQDLLLQVPFTARIITTDLVDDLYGIHPNYKWEIGRRYALKALSLTYKKDVLASGPEMKKVRYKDNTAIVFFDEVGTGLQVADGKPLTGFKIAGADSIYYPASAVIQGKTVVLTNKNVPQVRQVRFAWDEVAQPNLVNSAGLPAAPFRTENPYKNLRLK